MWTVMLDCIVTGIISNRIACVYWCVASSPAPLYVARDNAQLVTTGTHPESLWSSGAPESDNSIPMQSM